MGRLGVLVLASLIARVAIAAPSPTPTRPPTGAKAQPAATATPAATPTPKIPVPARGVPTTSSSRKVALLVHAPAVPGALSLARTVGDVLSASGMEVRAGSRLLEQMNAPARDPFAGIRARLESAGSKYLTLDLDGADGDLRAAEEALSSLLADPEAITWMRRILELRAIVLMAHGRVDASTEKLSALFLLDPDYQADPRLLSPQFQPAFERAAEEAALAPRGTMTVRTDPVGAEIYVDGKTAGVSPVTLELRGGGHLIQAYLYGYTPAGAAVRVDPTVPGEITLPLPPQPQPSGVETLARFVGTGVLPGGRAPAATQVRALSKSDAVAVVLARPSADGTLLSGEVHWDDPRIPPTRTPEFRLTSVASANARALATGLEKILSGPKPEPVVWKGRYIPPEVPDPFQLQVALGRLDNYGTGWSKTDIPENLPSASLSVTVLFRQQEQPYVALDWALTLGVFDGSRCYGPDPEQCRNVQSSQLFLDASPRLELKTKQVFGYGGLGFGIGNHTFRIQPVPDAPVQSDTVVVARAFVVAGVGVQVGRKARIFWEEKVATAQGTFPTTVLRDYDAKHLNVGGITHQLAVSYRF